MRSLTLIRNLVPALRTQLPSSEFVPTNARVDLFPQPPPSGQIENLNENGNADIAQNGTNRRNATLVFALTRLQLTNDEIEGMIDCALRSSKKESGRVMRKSSNDCRIFRISGEEICNLSGWPVGSQPVTSRSASTIPAVKS